MTIAFRPSPPLVPDARPEGAVCIDRIDVFDDVESAESVWRSLAAADSIASPYQGMDWVRLWQRHVGPHEKCRACIVAGFDDRDAPLFLWPLARRRIGPFGVAGFFGGKHATINMPLWRRDMAEFLTADDLRAILAHVARALPDLDLLILSNQPFAWNGASNPFARLPHHRSTEDNFVLPLGLPGQQIVEREISATMRSRLRNKERKLAGLPGYRYVRAASEKDVDGLLDRFFAQKAAKLDSLGLDNVFAEPGVEDFVRAACRYGLESGRPTIELHALEGDGEMLALFSGVHDGWRFTSNFNSHTAGDHARHSPGLILLQHLVTHCADRGLCSFDIGPGEARYKTFFCKQLEPLFDSVLPVSARARLLVVPLRLAYRAKSAIKRNPVLWSAASLLRRLIRRLRSRAA